MTDGLFERSQLREQGGRVADVGMCSDGLTHVCQGGRCLFGCGTAISQTLGGQIKFDREIVIFASEEGQTFSWGSSYPLPDHDLALRGKQHHGAIGLDATESARVAGRRTGFDRGLGTSQYRWRRDRAGYVLGHGVPSLGVLTLPGCSGLADSCLLDHDCLRGSAVGASVSDPRSGHRLHHIKA